MAYRPLRFIHTADWHLGRSCTGAPAEVRPVLRRARIEAIATIGRCAAEHDAAFVLVCGDVFDDHEVSPDTVQQALDVLADCPVPVYLLPGNHDPDTPYGIYRRPLWQRRRGEHVHVLSEPEPVTLELPGLAAPVSLLPAPWRGEHALEDPCRHLSADFGPPDGFRLGLAHGGNREIVERLGRNEGLCEEAMHTIPGDLAERARLDYLALGDWHSVMPIGERTWYSGTPEPTRFTESEPGHALLVTIERPGASPQLERLRVGRHRWRRHAATLTGAEDLRALARWIEAIEDKRDTLLELVLEGTLSLADRAALEHEVLTPARERLLWLRLRDARLLDRPSEADLEALTTADTGWLAEAARTLRARAETERESADALRLLYRLHRETERAP